MNHRFQMEWRVLSFVASVSLLAACSGAPSRHTSADRTALAQPPLEGRTLASLGTDGPDEIIHELSEERLQSYFDLLMSDEDPAKELRRSLEQLVAIYYRAQHQLHQVDRELESLTDETRKASGIAGLRSYPRMLAYWEISHRAHERIAYVYDHLLKISATRPRGSVEFTKARSALDALARFATKAEGADRLALHSLSVELKVIFDRHVARAKKSHRNDLAHSLTNTLFEKRDELADFARKFEIQEQLRVRGQAVAGSQPVLEQAADRISTVIQEGLTELGGADREPKSDGLRFFPSAGSHGSISGSEYPKGTWSLTFDDGPSAKYSPMVLKDLLAHDYHATIFELATNVHELPKTSLSYLDAGMEMANHSYTHPQLPKVTDAKLEHEIGDATEAEVKVWGEAHRPKLFRCPYGAGVNVPRVREALARHGFVHVFWNVDTLDWQDKNPDSILARAKKQMRAAQGGIILFHDIHPQSVEASRMLMDFFKEQGVRHRMVGEVIEELNHDKNR